MKTVCRDAVFDGKGYSLIMERVNLYKGSSYNWSFDVGGNASEKKMVKLRFVTVHRMMEG